MADIVIDTDVASLLQKSRAPSWVNRHVVGNRVWITFVSVGELWKWAEVRNWGSRNREALEVWLTRRPIIPYDEAIARTWGQLAATAQRRGRPRPQNDTWVAACCLRHRLGLLTLNRKDFVDFEQDGLVLLTEDD